MASGGAALAAIGVSASAVGMGAAISGTLAVGVMAVSDIMRGEVSDWQDYALAGAKGAIEGCSIWRNFGNKALKGAKLLLKCSSVVEFPF